MAGLRLSSAPGRWALLATVLGTSLAFLDATIVNIALPAIGADLHAPLSGLQWTLNGYTLALAGLILLGGSLSDRYGRRRVFLVGVVWFAAASTLCALAPNLGWLVAARVLQGVGAALLTPGSLALIQASFDPRDRARAVGAWSGLAGVATAVGPFLGGWLIEGPGWRWLFLINLPLSVVVIAVALRHLPESRDEAATGRFDVVGAALGAVALAGVTYALIAAPEPGGARVAGTAAVAGLVAAVGFLAVERLRANPMLPLSLFRSGQFSAVNAVTVVVYAALGGVSFLFMLQLQVVVGLPPVAAGAALLPVTVLMLALSARVGKLAQRVGPRWPMSAGGTLAGLGVLMLAQVSAGSSYVGEIMPATSLFGLGLSLIVAPLTATVLATAEVRRAGIASGVNNAVARAGQLLAVAGLPVLVGLSGSDYRDPAVFDGAFRLAMLICAGALVAGALLTVVTIRDDALRETPSHTPVVRPRCPTHCALAGPPLEPDEEAQPAQER
ncbi:MAG TPA: MFS transporter [Micromonosporaceae bacterium]